MCLELTRQRQRIVHAPFAARAVDGRDAEKQRLVSRPYRTHGIGDFERKPHAAFKAAAIAISTLVRHRRQKLMNQVAMRAVYFADIVARIDGALRGFAPGSEIFANVITIHRMRKRAARYCRQGTGREPLPRLQAVASIDLGEGCAVLQGAMRRCLATAMPHLNSRHRPERLDEIVDAAIRRDMAIVINAGAVVRLAPARLNRGLFPEDNATAAHGKAAKIDQLPVRGPAIVRNILAHRRTHDAIARNDRAQFDRCEQHRDFTRCDVHIHLTFERESTIVIEPAPASRRTPHSPKP